MLTSFWKPFILSLILFHGLTNPTEAMLLTSSPEITVEEVEGRALGLSLGMNWECRRIMKQVKEALLGLSKKKCQTNPEDPI